MLCGRRRSTVCSTSAACSRESRELGDRPSTGSGTVGARYEPPLSRVGLAWRLDHGSTGGGGGSAYLLCSLSLSKGRRSETRWSPFDRLNYRGSSRLRWSKGDHLIPGWLSRSRAARRGCVSKPWVRGSLASIVSTRTLARVADRPLSWIFRRVRAHLSQPFCMNLQKDGVSRSQRSPDCRTTNTPVAHKDAIRGSIPPQNYPKLFVPT
jgi:hypothetical protein